MTQSSGWFERPLAVVDVETTGLDPESDRVIEVAILTMAAGEVTQRYCSLVNPGREISEEVSNLTGIKQEELADAPSFETIADPAGTANLTTLAKELASDLGSEPLIDPRTSGGHFLSGVDHWRHHAAFAAFATTSPLGARLQRRRRRVDEAEVARGGARGGRAPPHPPHFQSPSHLGQLPSGCVSNM